jgi:Domain of unknown function (DUF5666)
MKINKKTYAIGTLALLATLVGSTSAFAENTVPNGPQMGNQGNHFGQIRKGGIQGMMRPAVIGQVTAVSGNTITITSKQIFDRKDNPTTTPAATTTTFTIDATNAKIEKGGTTGTLTSIIVGDTIMVQGTTTGTNVVATNIRDGIARGIDQNKNKDNKNTEGQIPTDMQGNGLPIVAGSVVSVTGNSIVITNKSNITYTIDATTAKIVKGPNAATITNIAVGDQVLAQGTVNGNSVVATSIYDQVKPATATTAPKAKGFFGKIGSFFGGLFGF